MRDYVGRNAQGTATVLWDAYRGAIGNNIPGNSSAESDNAANQISNSTPENKSPSENRPGGIRTHDQGIMSPLL